MEKRMSVFGFNEHYFDVNMKPADYDLSKLSPIRKNLYNEHPDVTNRSNVEVQSYMDLHKMIVIGRQVPKPLLNFGEGNFPECIERGLSEMNFEKPTCIQSQSWPVALSGRDMVGIAPTGFGKTLAYVLPSLIHISHQTPSSGPKDGPIVLILTPTGELALQTQTVCNGLGQLANIKNACFFGGVSEPLLLEEIERGAQIYIATPRRLLSLIRKGRVKLRNCTFVVVDEADLMLNREFENRIKKIFEQIRPDRQILMFSASWPTRMQRLAENFLVDHIQVKVGDLRLAANPNIMQNVEVVETSEKYEKLQQILRKIVTEGDNKILIFARKRNHAKIMTCLKKKGFQVLYIDHDMPQKKHKILEEFRNGSSQILMVSDIAARGLDIDGVSLVINFDFPCCIEEYIRCIGWTTKSYSSGTAYTFFTYDDMEQAEDLVVILQEADQTVDPKLLEIMEQEMMISGQFPDLRNLSNCRCEYCMKGEITDPIDGDL